MKSQENQDDVFYKALIAKDSTFEGTFIAGIKTTGIFCRPTCTARKPKRENVEFFSSTQEAIKKGYRACKVCHPMTKQDETPLFVQQILNRLEENPTSKIKEYDIKSMGIEPSQIRRWFKKNHGITFHEYQRMYRINHAFNNYKENKDIAEVAYSSGYESLSGFNSAYKNIIGGSPRNSIDRTIVNLTRIDTDLGTMIACASEHGVCLLEFSDRKMLETELKQIEKKYKSKIVQGSNKYLDLLKNELDLYFQGKLKKFTVTLDLVGTSFQKKVWNELIQIEYGEITTYKKQAKKLDVESAIRAVANANGMNKISIIIPCHRVIGTNGSLVGYGGGLWRKKKLLELEQTYKGLL